MLKEILRQNKYRIPLLALLFIALVWFIWEYNIRAMQINREINRAVSWQKQGNCAKALETMDKVLVSRSYIDGYARLKYADIINGCLEKEADYQQKIKLVEKAMEVVEENTVIRPTYTRNWWFLGGYGNYLINTGRKDLKEKTNYYFSQAMTLSPKRQIILKDWIKTHILTGEHEKAKEMAEECLEISGDFKECWWLKGISQIYLGEIEEGRANVAEAEKQGYNTKTEEALSQLLSVYTKTEYYPGLIETYKELIKLDPANFQHYASLAFCYKMTEDYEEARQAAQKVIELSPESKTSVEEFLRNLK